MVLLKPCKHFSPNFYFPLRESEPIERLQALVQIVVFPADMRTPGHSICFLADYLCKISFSRNQEKSHSLPLEIQSLKDNSVLLCYTDCVSRSSASQHTKNNERNQCDLLARRYNCLSKLFKKQYYQELSCTSFVKCW